MSKRPYFKSRIEELEKIFRSSQNDLDILGEIVDELQFRNTARAKKLHTNITNMLIAKGADYNSLSSTMSSNSDSSNIVFKPNNLTAVSLAENGYPEDGNRMDLSLHPNIGITISHDHSEELNVNQERRDNLERTLTNADVPEAEAVITAWLTQEILTPQPLPSESDLRAIRRQLVNLAEIPEPWKDERFKKQGKETAIFWMIYLGEINLAKAMESIIKLFPDEMAEERSVVRGNTTIAVIVVDAQGRLVSDRTFLSGFAWGYGQVRAGRIKELSLFAEAQAAIKVEIEKRLINKNDDGEIQPITSSDLDKVSDWLVNGLNLPEDEVVRPGSAVRVPQYGLYNDEPEPDLLNSFFIEDLVRIRNEFLNESVGNALSTYMRGYCDRIYQDIVKDKDLLAETFAPERLPLTRWPGPGRHPLVLMQQAAINHAVHELADGGLVAVNGPPGTGKTTLLRDIVAKVVLDRAIAMSQFEKPEMAFKHITFMKTGQAFSHLYQLDDKLLGHEIVVASSNNKAVENISREIPSATAIADDFESPVRYFQSVSDAIAAGEKEIVDGATWGLSAAVLGNASNRAAFIKSFWWDKQRGMAPYLGAILGNKVSEAQEEADNESSQPSIPEIVILEKPPCNEIEALEHWHLARKEFIEKLQKVKVLRAEAQEFYKAVKRKKEVIRYAENAAASLIAAKQGFILAEESVNNANVLYEQALGAERRAVENRLMIDRMRPGFFSRLFRTKAYRDWYQRMVRVVDEVNKVQDEVKEAMQTAENAKKVYSASQKKLADTETENIKADQVLKATLAIIAEGQKRIGNNFADESFWLQDDAKLQTMSPWVFPDFQLARDELFVAAFGLHRAFIDASAKFMRHNIRVALEMIKGRGFTEKQEIARRSLWASLFMVVPVISTTFASTTKLFGKLGREQLGWLLIDEAGQVAPQAALGALWRAKRAIVIGDPLQIEPVVPIPPKLINAIFSQFGVPKDEWAAPDVSAQILADRSSWLGTTINSDDGEIWVGAPLRVHRRCQKPMFSISNYIAYNGLMVYGTPDGKSSIGDVLGASTWIDVRGDANGKWSRDEGMMALDLLMRLFVAGIDDPDVFFITPFRIVASEFREMIRRNDQIKNRLPQAVWEWTNERVGTVHTFQGKEADTVVLVLGAPLDSSGGARRWAGGSPNLLNVAVTRAKRRLYVVGNRDAWKKEGYFRHLATSLSRIDGTDWQSYKG